MSSSAEPVGTQSMEQGNVARIRDRLSKDMNSLHLSGIGAAPKKPPKPAAAMSSNKVAHVRFSYVAQQEDELSLVEDDVVEFLEDVEDGWARGRLRERVGLFPTNFVSFATAPTTNTASMSVASLSRVSEEGQQQRMSSVRKSLINPTVPKEEPQTNGKSSSAEKVEPNMLPSHFKASSRKPNGVSSNSNIANKLPNASNGKEYAKVLYDYRAAHTDELDLKEGDIIQILSRKSTDEGWCEGEVGGRRGLFPENFVRVMSAATVASPPAPSATTATTVPTTMAAPERPPAPAATTAQTAPPPLLPAKPVKAKSAERESATPATKSGAESTPNGTPPSGAAMREDSSRSPPPTNVHTTLEQRKSMLAGLTLFPPGKRPKQSGFGDAPLLSSSTTGSSPPLTLDPESAPVVMRSTNSESDASDEPKRLDSTAAKSRPRQEGKRPPSAHFRSSRMAKSDNISPTSTALPSIPSPPSSPTRGAIPSAPTEASTVVSTGATTSFPADAATTSSASPRGAELARELNGIVSAIASTKTAAAPSVPQMGSKHSRQPSGKDETDQPAVSRAEFDDVLKRLAALEEQVAKLLVLEKL